jgi:hypothetical protein
MQSFTPRQQKPDATTEASTTRTNRCDRCDSHVTDAFIRVFSPSDSLADLNGCPHCKDRTIAIEGLVENRNLPSADDDDDNDGVLLRNLEGSDDL